MNDTQKTNFFLQNATITISETSQDQDCWQVRVCSLLSCALQQHGQVSKRTGRGGLELSYVGAPGPNGTGVGFKHQEMSPEEKKALGDKISAGHQSKSPEEKKAHGEKISAAYQSKSPEEKKAHGDKISAASTNKDHQWEEIMGSSDPTDEEVVALLGEKLTGGREQLTLVITQIDAALGEKVRKERVSIAKLKKILVFIST